MAPMLDSRSNSIADVVSPSLVPDAPIDRAHLLRMTLGDHALEGEVLRLFVRQAGMLLSRMRQAEPTRIAALAHTLDGSARGIGAWRIAQAAQALEQAAASHSDLQPMVDMLRNATDEALLVIADLLRAH
jgi:HPt (histidine-containing phosphotransfer) domain-containing protein